jgi:hypothetical protein
LFGFVALEAVVLNKAVSLIVVASALPFRSRTVAISAIFCPINFAQCTERGKVDRWPGQLVFNYWKQGQTRPKAASSAA